MTSPQNYQDGTPVSSVVLGAGYTWEKLEIDGQGRWQSRFTDYTSTGGVLRPVYVADYMTVLARVGYNLTDHVILGLTGQQFNVSRLIQSAGPPVERSVIGSVTVKFELVDGAWLGHRPRRSMSNKTARSGLLHGCSSFR